MDVYIEIGSNTKLHVIIHMSQTPQWNDPYYVSNTIKIVLLYKLYTSRFQKVE